MNKENSCLEYRKYYLKEFEFYDGEYFIKFNIIDINFDKKTITLAVTNRGRISVIEYDLYQDSNKDFYFRYGVEFKNIELKNFETIKD